jgi:peptidoglycan/xylan/chitin deacetylase (PgdA/CDA1 family)
MSTTTRLSGRRLPILMYHSISDTRPDPNQICVSPKRFAEQLAWLHHHGYRGVSMVEFLDADAHGRGERLVGMTFDDGYDDFRTNAVPLLNDAGFTATVFVISDRLGGENEWDDEPRLRLMDAAGVREVAQRGMEIGCHSSSHARLLSVDDEHRVHEMVDSRAALKEIVGVDVQGFAYPYGDADESVAAIAKDAGYGYACATKPGNPASPWLLPRRFVGERDGGMRLRLKLALAGR